MATIRKREGKTGTSYQIRASCGYDSKGKQIIRSETWRPEPGMTPAQIKRELQRRIVALECKETTKSGAVKFQDFAEEWFKEVAERTLSTAAQTCVLYPLCWDTAIPPLPLICMPTLSRRPRQGPVKQ